MSQPKCCSCNGTNAKCIGCKCARNRVICTSCYPGRHGRCKNISTPLDANSCFSSNQSPPTRIVLSSGVSTDSVSQEDNPVVSITDLVKKLRQCRSAVITHIPKASRYQFAKTLANAIEIALNQNDLTHWSRLLLLPTICLRSPPHNGKRHSTSLSTLINNRISFF